VAYGRIAVIDLLGPVRRVVVGVCVGGIFLMFALYALSKFLLYVVGIVVVVALIRIFVVRATW
jgi:hypothetical protein